MAKTGGDISIALEVFTSCHSSLKIQTCVGKLETESQEMEVELKRRKRERERTGGQAGNGSCKSTPAYCQASVT